LPDNSELLMENTLGEFGAEFLGTIHWGVSRAPVLDVPYPFTRYGFLKRSMIFGSKGASTAQEPPRKVAVIPPSPPFKRERPTRHVDTVTKVQRPI
jgi:hypothetical protein